MLSKVRVLILLDERRVGGGGKGTARPSADCLDAAAAEHEPLGELAGGPERPRMVDNDRPPILRIEDVLLGPVLVGDETVAGPGQLFHLVRSCLASSGDGDALLLTLSRLYLFLAQ